MQIKICRKSVINWTVLVIIIVYALFSAVLYTSLRESSSLSTSIKPLDFDLFVAKLEYEQENRRNFIRENIDRKRLKEWTIAEDATNLLVMDQSQENIDVNFEVSTDNTSNLDVNADGTGVPMWQRKLRSTYNTRTGKYFLTVVVMVRIYEDDKAKWTIRELKQWIHYMFWAGVDHVYLCDHFVTGSENLNKAFLKYVDHGLLTYIPWPWNATDEKKTRHIFLRHKAIGFNKVAEDTRDKTEWQMMIDMDEYPFCPNDLEEGFLRRYIRNISKIYNLVTQILMPNFLMLGQGDRTRNITIERINRITPKVSNQLTKPLFKPYALSRADIHIHSMKYGQTYRESGTGLKMLHYWGARLQDWGEDTTHIMDITVEFDVVREEMAPIIRNSLLSFGEKDAFSSATGP